MPIAMDSLKRLGNAGEPELYTKKVKSGEDENTAEALRADTSQIVYAGWESVCWGVGVGMLRGRGNHLAT